jgi:hypothetical protein
MLTPLRIMVDMLTHNPLIRKGFVLERTYSRPLMCNTQHLAQLRSVTEITRISINLDAIRVKSGERVRGRR